MIRTQSFSRARLVRQVIEAVRLIIVFVFTVVAVFLPLWVLFINSAKPLAEAQRLDISLPSQWQLVENYSEVIRLGSVFPSMVNTLIVVVPVVLGTMIVASAAAWVFARRKSRLSGALYAFCIAGVILPPILITTIYLLRALGLYGGFAGTIIFYIAAFESFAVFLATGFVRAIPVELEESARIDGASHTRVFVSIVLPLLRPGLFTLSVFLFLFVWNDFLFQYFMLGGRGHDTLSLGLYQFAQVRLYQTAWHLVFADVFIVSLPPLVVFFLMQRRILSGLTQGALKH